MKRLALYCINCSVHGDRKWKLMVYHKTVPGKPKQKNGTSNSISHGWFGHGNNPPPPPPPPPSSFRLSCFHLAKEKNKNRHNESYFYSSVVIWGLGKRKGVLSFPFSYLLLWNRKTKKERMVYTRTQYCPSCVGPSRAPGPPLRILQYQRDQMAFSIALSLPHQNIISN